MFDGVLVTSSTDLIRKCVNGTGASRSKFLQFSLLKVMANHWELGREAPGANSFGSPR